MNDDTFEEKISLVLSPSTVFVTISALSLFLITIVIYTVAFTPLREYIPGYADPKMRKQLIALSLKTDSMEQALKNRDVYITAIKNVISGNINNGKFLIAKDTVKKKANLNLAPSKEDSILRAEIEAQDKYTLSVSSVKFVKNKTISNLSFFVPLKGLITSGFKKSEEHYGVDVVASPNEAVKATLDGTVIAATWTLETGYIIEVQHENNLISIYKHNFALLKKTGDRVRAGDVIAIVGNSGELTTGPHLHFELWYNGTPLNPQEYMSFN